MTKATALVQYGAADMRFEEFDLPKLGEGELLIRVEANGLFGSDVDFYHALDWDWYAPRILDHEVAGLMEDMGSKSVNRHGLEVGDRVCVSPYVSCGICDSYLLGDQVTCTGFATKMRYGIAPTSVPPSLWGGYSTHAIDVLSGKVPQENAINVVVQPVSY